MELPIVSRKKWNFLGQRMRSVRRTAASATNTSSQMNDPEIVLLIDSWRDQEAIDVHHASPMMGTIVALREKYDFHMKVERYVSDELRTDEKFIRK